MVPVRSEAESPNAGWLTLSRLVMAFAALLIVLAASGLVFVGHVASRKADALATGGERRLLDNALTERFQLLARDQLSLARWDRSVEKLANTFERGFVDEELVDSLWYDFGHDRVYVVGRDGTILARSNKDVIDFTRQPVAGIPPLQKLVDKAAKRFVANRIKTKDGYAQKTVPIEDVSAVASFAYLHLNGKPYLASAMAVVPDDGEAVLKRPEPVLLISAKRIDGDLMSGLRRQLELNALTFSTQAHATTQPASRIVKDIGGGVFGVFHWKSAAPGDRLWSVVIPVIILIGSMLALCATLIARRIGRLTARLEESERTNRHMAAHDGLTGLANRLSFDAALDRAADRPCAVLGCDLDRFKAVNDTYGHAAGDTVIRAIARRLEDAVGNAGLVGRIGGDEFLILIHDYTDRPRLTILSRQIIASVCDPVELETGQTAEVGISIGIAVSPEDGVTRKDLMAKADAALYAAKERGRGIAVFARDLLPGADEAATDVAGAVRGHVA